MITEPTFHSSTSTTSSTCIHSPPTTGPAMQRASQVPTSHLKYVENNPPQWLREHLKRQRTLSVGTQLRRQCPSFGCPLLHLLLSCESNSVRCNTLPVSPQLPLPMTQAPRSVYQHTRTPRKKASGPASAVGPHSSNQPILATLSSSSDPLLNNTNGNSVYLRPWHKRTRPGKRKSKPL